MPHMILLTRAKLEWSTSETDRLALLDVSNLMMVATAVMNAEG